MSKPIESGCRAVIVNTRNNNGKIVEVGKRLGVVDGYFDINNNHWEVDKQITYTGGESLFHIDEYYLRRIDDDEQELSSWEAVEKVCGFIPNRETA